MINCRVVFLDGPPNSHSAEVGKLLSQSMPDSVLLEGATLVAREDLSEKQWIVATVMTSTLRACELAHEGKLPMISFPLRDSDWKVISGLCEHAGVKPICITLNPSQQRSFSSLTIQTADLSPETTSQQIQNHLSAL